MREKTTRVKFRYLLVLAAVIALVWSFWPSGGTPSESLSSLQKQVAQDQVVSADMNTKDHVLTAKLKEHKTFKVAYPSSYEDDLVNQLRAKDVSYKISKGGYDWGWAFGILPLILIFAAMLFLLRGGASGGLSMLPKLGNFAAERPQVRFADVMGANEAIADLQLVVEALKDPENYSGPAIDQGVIVHGETGTGKTLLAKAVAGEAGVPFYYLSGPALTSMFVNHSARLVVEFFTSVKKSLKDSGVVAAIIFVDELDGLAHKRSVNDNTFGGQQERNTTTDALLHELGILFEHYPYVVVIAATNYLQNIDDAMLRPGRLGKHIPMPKPDVLARQNLFDLYTKSHELDKAVDLQSLAQLTSDMTGAQIEEVVKEAERLTYRVTGGKSKVLTMDTLRTAVIRVAMGVPRESAAVHHEDATIAAIHESGHTVAALNTERFTLQHVTIIPIAQSGGSTWHTRDDRQLVTHEILCDELTVLLGGLAAEQLFNPNQSPSAGSSHDLAVATDMAVRTVCTTAIGGVLMSIDPDTWEDHPQASLVGHVVQGMLDEGLNRATELITTHRQLVENLRDSLLNVKALGREQVLEIQRQTLGA